MPENIHRIFIPVSKIEDDSYDWWKRHETKVQWAKEHHAEVVFIGDSITHFWSSENGINHGEGHWDALFAGQPVLNLGYGFDRIQNVLWRIEHGELDRQDPKLFIINIGTNQYSITPRYSGDTPEETVCGQVHLLKELISGFPKAHFIVMALFPRKGKMENILETNKLMHQQIPQLVHTELLDLTEQFCFADGSQNRSFFQPDGCHLCRKGYQIWAQNILPKIKKYAGLDLQLPAK